MNDRFVNAEELEGLYQAEIGDYVIDSEAYVEFEVFPFLVAEGFCGYVSLILGDLRYMLVDGSRRRISFNSFDHLRCSLPFLRLFVVNIVP